MYSVVFSVTRPAAPHRVRAGDISACGATAAKSASRSGGGGGGPGLIFRDGIPHCPKTKERKFNLGVLNLYETHFIDLSM